MQVACTCGWRRGAWRLAAPPAGPTEWRHAISALATSQASEVSSSTGAAGTAGTAAARGVNEAALGLSLNSRAPGLSPLKLLLLLPLAAPGAAPPGAPAGWTKRASGSGVPRCSCEAAAVFAAWIRITRGSRVDHAWITRDQAWI